MGKNRREVFKAYENLDFIKSPDGRILRVIAELMEPKRRFRKQNIKDTIVFFGSARTKSTEDLKNGLKELRKREEQAKSQERRGIQQEISFLEGIKGQCKYYDDAVELSRLLTVWSKKINNSKHRFIVTSGGGGGIMEAANKGAFLAKGKTIGLNISIPFEQTANPYISNELNFEFHYFFIRKFWFIYLAKALVIFPGGFGTLDELMEVLTLIQTQKVKKKIPIVIYGKDYWHKVINLEEMARQGVIDSKDLALFRFANTPKEAFDYLSKELTELYL